MKTKIWITIITIIILLITAYPADLAHLLTYTDSNVTLDLFTQKKLYNGRGPNQPSDMFGPQENVIIYASLMVNGVPTIGKLVTFKIAGPVENITFYRTAETNESGIAETWFSLAVMNQTMAFGTWVVTGIVEVNNKIYKDVLRFSVGWIVELLSVRTIDKNLNNRMYFGIGGDVGFEISLKNNAMTKKVVSIAITIFDELDEPVNFSQIQNFVVAPNGKIICLYYKLSIPKHAVPGSASIHVSALNVHRVPYCPEISTTFRITIYDVIFLDFIDASIAYVDVFPNKAVPGENIEITAFVRNEGTVTLNNFNVYVHANTSLIDSRSISSLEPFNCKSFNVIWNTSSFPEGTYVINVTVQTFPEEVDLSDNTFTSLVELKTPTPIYTHDLRVLKVNCSKKFEVYQGEKVNITVTVRNNGNSTESTVVKLCYNQFLIKEKNITEIAPSAEEELSFQWDTTNIPEGEYRIIAIATPVEGEKNTTNNIYYGCIIRVRVKKPQIVHDVAVSNLKAEPSEVFIGETVRISTRVENLGTEPESFNVRLLYNNFPITTLTVNFLAPRESMNLTYFWDTSSVLEGNYTIKAYVIPVEGEQNTANNLLTYYAVWIKAPKIPVRKHDIAVTALNVSEHSVYQGDKVNITIRVTNLGDFNEKFSVSVYANMSEIWHYRINVLQAGSSRTLNFTWKTNINVGKYTIWARAEYLTGETNFQNNICIDDVVSVRARAKPWVPAYWKIPEMLALLILLATLIGSCMTVLLWKFKRRRTEQKGRRSAFSEAKSSKEDRFKTSKTCSVCGKEFPATYTFCPYCFTFHGKDYE